MHNIYNNINPLGNNAKAICAKLDLKDYKVQLYNPISVLVAFKFG